MVISKVEKGEKQATVLSEKKSVSFSRCDCTSRAEKKAINDWIKKRYAHVSMDSDTRRRNKNIYLLRSLWDQLYAVTVALVPSKNAREKYSGCTV
jgi:hypothetical protein